MFFWKRKQGFFDNLAFVCYFIALFLTLPKTDGNKAFLNSEKLTMLKQFHDYFFPGDTVPLHVMMLNCGHDCNTNRNYSWNGMRRVDGRLVIWQYTLSGLGAIDIGGRTYELRPGKAFLVRVPGDHTYYMPRNSSKWEFLYCTMTGSEAESLADLITEQYGHILDFAQDSMVVEQARQLIQSPKAETISPYQLSLIAYRFILSILEELEKSPARSAEAQLLDRVNTYLASHLGQGVMVSGLARAMGISRSHFSRLFHEASGSTVQHYILESRLRLGARLLLTENLSVKEISARSGFNDVNYFCRAFRKQFALSPEQYRRMNR